MQYLLKYSRLIIACLLAFGISNLIFTHQYLTPIEFNALRLKEDVVSVMTSISSIHFELPKMELFSQRIAPTAIPTDIPDEIVPTIAYETPPTDIPLIPTSIAIEPSESVSPSPIYTSPSTSPRTPTPSHRPTIQPTRTPTKTATPTKTPKPTKPPDVFPVDPSLQRPGTNADEVFTIAAQKSCVPKEILRTLASIESGGFFTVVSPKWFMLYNSYNWWNSAYIEDKTETPTYQRICSGYGYDYGTGLITDDSKFAGMSCRKDGTTGTRSYIMGPMQMSERLQYNQGPQVAKLLGVKQIDRRVILDAITLAGVVTKINVKEATSCTNWSARDMVKAACGYYGSCGFKDKTYYCNTFCRNIKEYGGKDCSSAVSQFADDNCWK